MSNPETLQKQDGFKSKWGFIMACIGSAVGMANIWRFPVMVSTYGGLTFLIPYFIFVVLIGCSGVMEEFALGRRAVAGPVGAFGMCTEERTGKKGIGEAFGALPIIGALMLAIFALQDSFGTACNVTGDGALTLFLTGYVEKHNIEETNIQSPIL